MTIKTYVLNKKYFYKKFKYMVKKHKKLNNFNL